LLRVQCTTANTVNDHSEKSGERTNTNGCHTMMYEVDGVCDDCDDDGDIREGYGGMHVFECRNCGNEWVEP